MRKAATLSVILLSFILVAALLSCGPYYGYGAGYYGHPPPWETVGTGVFIRYYYYPEARIYYRPDRHYYFYHHDRKWHRVKHLPDGYKTHGGRVKLRMRDEEPYRWHGEVEKRYPRRGEGPRREGGRRR